MPEGNKKEMKIYHISYICDECKNGEMLPTGFVYSAHPPQYEHQCTSCHSTRAFLNKVYPLEIKEVV